MENELGIERKFVLYRWEKNHTGALEHTFFGRVTKLEEGDGTVFGNKCQPGSSRDIIKKIRMFLQKLAGFAC